MTAATSPGVVERLKARGLVVAALEAVLGRRIDPERTSANRCVRPNLHRNGDANPSMIVEPDAGGVRCAACGFAAGLLALGVEVGYSADEAGVARRLAVEVLGDEAADPARNGHAAPPPRAAPRASSWPPSAETCAAFGWTLGEARGVAAVRCPIYDADLKPCGVKVRGPRGADGRLVVHLEPAEDGRREPGLIGAEVLADLGPGALVLVTEGESDLVALRLAAAREGLTLAAVSPSNGCKQDLAAVAGAFRGLRVALVFDGDDAGREGAAAAVEALRGVAAEVLDVNPVTDEERARGAKDLRDVLDGGASAREVLRRIDAARAASQRFTLTGAGDLLGADLPPLRFLVADGVLPAGGLGLLVARQKRGKTLAGLGLSLKIVRRASMPDAALEWFGSPVVGAGSVVYLSGEGGELLVRERLAKMVPDLPLAELNRLRILARRPWPNLADARDLAEIAAVIRETGAVLLVVDPLARFLPVENENDSSEMTRALGGIRALAEETGCAVLLIHHDKKGESIAGVVTGGRGSSVLGAEADSLINMTPDPDGDRASSLVHFECRWAAAPEGCRVRIDPESLHVEFVARLTREGPRPKPGPETKVTVVALREALVPVGEWVTRREVAARLGVTDGAVRKHLAPIRSLLVGDLEESMTDEARPKARLRLLTFEQKAAKAAAANAPAPGPIAAPQTSSVPA